MLGDRDCVFASFQVGDVLVVEEVSLSLSLHGYFKRNTTEASVVWSKQQLKMQSSLDKMIQLIYGIYYCIIYQSTDSLSEPFI